MDKYTNTKRGPCPHCVAPVNRLGDRLVAASSAYAEALDECASALSPSAIAYDMCREALVSYVDHTEGRGHPGGLGALIPMLRHATDRKRLLRISRDVIRASRAFTNVLVDCARYMASGLPCAAEEWKDLFCGYLESTDNEGHPDGLYAWLVAAFDMNTNEHDRPYGDGGESRPNAPGGAA